MSEIQAVLFDKTKWNTTKARAKLANMKLTPIKKVHITDRYLRYRINDPEKYNVLLTSHGDNNITYIIGVKKR